MSALTTTPKEFFRKLQGESLKPLKPDSPLYVPLRANEPGRDPILNLKTKIEWAESESVNLLTGFRGNGKSTELLRLKAMLEHQGCKVYLVDMLDGLLLTKPLEVSDFLLALMAGLSRAIETDGGLNPVREGYWERLRHFLSSEVVIEGLNLGSDVAVAAELSFSLKTDPTFKQRVQERLRGHVTTLVKEAQRFVTELVASLRIRAMDPDLKVVLLVDSVEQIRGIGEEAAEVHRSVVDTFSSQASSLAFPTMHVVYTVPPFFLALAPNAARPFGGTVTSWPNVHVRDSKGAVDPGGLELMEKMVAAREPAWESRISSVLVRRLAGASGGDIRDFFRLLRECLVILGTGGTALVDDEVVGRAEQELRRELLPIADDDARWLARVHAEKQPALQSVAEVSRFARFLDSNLVMNYLNGEPWYDIHPLVVNEVIRLGARPESG